MILTSSMSWEKHRGGNNLYNDGRNFYYYKLNGPIREDMYFQIMF